MFRNSANFLNFLYSSSWILASVFIPVIARKYTDNLFHISLVLALYNGTLFFSSIIFGRLGDIHSRRKILLIGFGVSAFAFAMHNFAGNIIALFLVRGFSGIGVGMIPGALSALAWGSPLGIFTAIGALGYTLGNFLSGILKNDILIFSVSAILCLGGLVLSFFLKEEKKKISVPALPLEMIFKNLNVYLPFFIRHSAAQAIWAVFPIYLLGLGANRFQIGLMYALNPFAQFVFMLVMDRYRSDTLINLGIIFSALTFLGYAIAPSWQVIAVFQVLLGFSWGNLYLGSTKFLLENNLEQSTATGFLSSVMGLSGIVGPIIGGVIALLGLRTLMLASAMIAGLALLTRKKGVCRQGQSRVE